MSWPVAFVTLTVAFVAGVAAGVIGVLVLMVLGVTQVASLSGSDGIRTGHDGRRSLDANTLIRTPQAKQHLANIAKARSPKRWN